MAKEVLHLTKDTMEAAVAEGITLVDFWADWCGPCKMVAPILDELYAERDDFQLAKIDTDAEPELAEGFGIQGIPTVILFKDGKAEIAAVGVRPKEFYVEMLDEFIQTKVDAEDDKKATKTAVDKKEKETTLISNDSTKTEEEEIKTIKIPKKYKQRKKKIG